MLSLTDEPICFFSSKTVWVYSDGKPRACQKLGNGSGAGKCPVPGLCKIWKCPNLGHDKADKCPAVAQMGGGELGAAGIDWCITTGFPRKIVSLRYRTAERRGRQNAYVWKTWQPYYLCAFGGDLHLSDCFLVFYMKMFKGGWSSAEKFFKQNYCHACHTRFAAGLNVCWNSILMTFHYPDLSSASDCSREMCLNHSKPLPRSG